MNRVVARVRVPSMSEPDKTYTVRWFSDQTCDCSCPDPREGCKHIRFVCAAVHLAQRCQHLERGTCVECVVGFMVAAAKRANEREKAAVKATRERLRAQAAARKERAKAKRVAKRQTKVI